MMDASRSEEPRSHKRKIALWATFAVVVVAAGLGLTLSAGVLGGQGAKPSTAATSPSSSPLPTATPGSTDASEQGTAEAVPLDEPADFGDSVTGRVVSLERFTSEGGVPGEPAGDAVRVTVEVTNTGGSEVDIRRAVVTAVFGEDALPGAELAMDSEGEFPDILRPGASATVVRAFSIPAGSGSTIRVSLDLLAGKPLVEFEGVVPTV